MALLLMSGAFVAVMVVATLVLAFREPRRRPSTQPPVNKPVTLSTEWHARTPRIDNHAGPHAIVEEVIDDDPPRAA